jgi:hypothetical protein
MGIFCDSLYSVFLFNAVLGLDFLGLALSWRLFRTPRQVEGEAVLRALADGGYKPEHWGAELKAMEADGSPSSLPHQGLGPLRGMVWTIDLQRFAFTPASL